MTFRTLCVFAALLSTGPGCQRNISGDPSLPPEAIPDNSPVPSFKNVFISTDKAIYKPGDVITFTIDAAQLPALVKVRYKHLNTTLAEETLTGPQWTWKAPPEDFRGYMAEVYDIRDGMETIYASIGIDVSSSWTKFPRYGFLSDYPQLSDAEIDAVVSNLNRHHINGIQFYDWHNKHHIPLPGAAGNPPEVWKDIMNRDVHLATVRKYIDAVHGRGMKAMYYNLIYGAWDKAGEDGVRNEWYVYNDNTHTNRDFHPLPSPPFLSDIYLLDPSDPGWQDYIGAENKKVYAGLPFDGFHMDQLGDRGGRYTYDGSFLNLSQTYKPFIERVKADNPEKAHVMNAVNQYGQQGIAQSPVDFLYTEVWPPFDTYSDLANIIKQNNTLGGNAKNSVLAAYVNYNLADHPGSFNTPAVLMANAVIFAFGGAHLELGEHMLGKEYFPNDNLKMKDDLERSLVAYYDFLTAYENLLRDGGTFNTVDLHSPDNKIAINSWPPAQGAVAALGKKAGSRQVIHLLNFKDAKTMNWRDNTGVQAVPAMITDTRLTLTSPDPVKKIWAASPGVAGGASQTLNFIQSGDEVSFILPQLRYWTMIVVEYEPV